MFTREGRIGCMLWVGLGLIALGFALTFVMMLGGLASVANTGSRGWLDASVLPLSLVILGVLLCAFNLFRMWWIPFRASHSAQIDEHPGAYVIAKTAFDRNMNMSFPTEPEEGLRYYVTLQFQDGRKAELRTSVETFFSVGEGMKGAATVQGDWLGMFVADPPKRILGE